MSDPTAAATKQSLHDWHRETFTKRVDATIVYPSYRAMFGNIVPEQVVEAKLGTAGAAVVQRTLNAMSPDEWKAVQAGFDASDAGKALTATDAPTRREHAELWAAHHLHETDHEDLVPVTELALQKVLAHHAQESKLAGHKTRLLTHANLLVSTAQAAATAKPALVSTATSTAPKTGAS